MKKGEQRRRLGLAEANTLDTILRFHDCYRFHSQRENKRKIWMYTIS